MATACCIASIVAPLAILRSAKTTDGGETRPIVYGTFKAVDWVCSDLSMSFSDARLKVSAAGTGQSSAGGMSSQEQVATPQAGTAYLVDQLGDRQCAISFTGQYLSSLRFDTLEYIDASFCGYATYANERVPFALTFPLANDQEKIIDIAFGDAGSSVYGTVYFMRTS